MNLENIKHVYGWWRDSLAAAGVRIRQVYPKTYWISGYMFYFVIVSIMVFDIVHVVLSILSRVGIHPDAYSRCWKLITDVHELEYVQRLPFWKITTACIFFVYLVMLLTCYAHELFVFFGKIAEHNDWEYGEAVFSVLAECFLVLSHSVHRLFVNYVKYGYAFFFFALLALICLSLCYLSHWMWRIARTRTLLDLGTRRAIYVYNIRIRISLTFFIFVWWSPLVLGCYAIFIIFPLTHDALLTLLEAHHWDASDENNYSISVMLHLCIAEAYMVALYVFDHLFYFLLLCRDFANLLGLHAEWVWVYNYFTYMCEVVLSSRIEEHLVIIRESGTGSR